MKVTCLPFSINHVITATSGSAPHRGALIAAFEFCYYSMLNFALSCGEWSLDISNQWLKVGLFVLILVHMVCWNIILFQALTATSETLSAPHGPL